MLRLENITKVYKSGDMSVNALKGISLSFRKSEFVSILGPSGCGKTTLLNIIGGLDKYTDGDLIINGKNTKDFSDKDWDTYRNNHIGFVFQSYNLIPHQTILENVMLALTISGVKKEDKVEKAKVALDKVGLKGLYNKKPNQLSGGQCQRVAIARALVNEPEILLADEPTGALDTETSVQIMELIKEISKEKLVIMVTHNPDLAYQYSTRIVKVLDGNILEDSNPYDDKEENVNFELEHNKNKKSKMSFYQALKLSMKNLWSKSKRTILTCFAGSIGIIGVCSVLAVSSGVKGYIEYMQDDMLSGNPITIDEQAYDIQKFMEQMSLGEKTEAIIKNGIVNVDSLIQYFASMVDGEDGMIISNDLNENYLNYIKEMPKEFYNAILYKYGINMANNIYTDFTNGNEETKLTSLSGINQIYTKVLSETQFGDYASLITGLNPPISQAVNNEEYILSQYNLLNGKFATEKDEIMIVVNKDQALNDLQLAQLGYYSQPDFIESAMNYKNPDYQYKDEFTFDELMGKEFYYMPNNSIYQTITEFFNEVSPGLGNFMGKDFEKHMPFVYKSTMKDNKEGMKLKVVGILMPKEDKSYGTLSSGFFYTEELVKYSVENSINSEIIKYAKAHADEKGDFIFGESTGIQTSNRSKFVKNAPISSEMEQMMAMLDQVKQLKNAIGFPFEYYPFVENGKPTKKSNFSVMMAVGGNSMNNMINSMVGNSKVFGPSIRELGGETTPSGINIYPINFEEKDLVTDYLDKWNSEETITVNDVVLTKDDRRDVTYQDNLEVVISMINTMIDMVTVALISFTSLSLVVSCVMIAIITYVSVMERIKEIGIIRALGGRKRDVSNLFNAETLIIGTVSGALGIGITYLMQVIANIVVKNMIGYAPIANLVWWQALLMLGISIALTTLSGFIPARSASKKDPVVALRTE